MMINTFPFAVKSQVLNGWIKLNEFGKLDTAFGRNDRKLFRDLISSYPWSHLNAMKSNEGFASQCVINWISARRFRILHCFVGSDCKILSPEYPPLLTDVLEVLCDKECNKQWLVDIMNQWFAATGYISFVCVRRL
jgi:hypothetical protein